jgi:hypothetical protein
VWAVLPILCATLLTKVVPNPVSDTGFGSSPELFLPSHSPTSCYSGG